MSIESSGATATTRTAEIGGAAAARGQRGGAGAHEAAGAPSFLSLLLSLEPQVEPQAQAGAAPAADAGDDPEALAKPSDPMAMLERSQGYLAWPSQPDPAVEPGQELVPVALLSVTTAEFAPASGAAPATVAGQEMMPVALVSVATVDLARVPGAAPATVAGQETMPVALVSAATVDLARVPGAAPAGVGPSDNLVDHVAGKSVSGDPGSRLSADQGSGVPMRTGTERDANKKGDAGAAEALPAQVSMQGSGRTSRQTQEAGLSLFSTGALGQAEDRRVVVDGAKADQRAANSTMTANASTAGGLMADAGGNPGKGLVVLRGSDRPGTRSMLAPTGPATAGAWADPLVNAGGVGPGIVFALDSAAALPEAVVAERINYWISRGVQSAELRLDAFGGGAVAVSISVQGNEAMVEFRSDQPEARRLLAGAMSHLSDLLEQEGLVLSGGFVGTSAQDEPGARERKGAAQATRGSMIGVEIPATGATLVQGRAPGRVVDLFV